MDDLAFLFGAGLAAIAIASLVGIACYVLFSLSHYKALKRLNYANAWLAWIPYVVNYAMADAVTVNDGEQIRLIGSVEIPKQLYKFWWLIAILLPFIPLGFVGTILNLALGIICGGFSYIRMYAMLDAKSESEEQVIGYISGAFPIVAVVKFLIMK